MTYMAVFLVRRGCNSRRYFWWWGGKTTNLTKHYVNQTLLRTPTFQPESHQMLKFFIGNGGFFKMETLMIPRNITTQRCLLFHCLKESLVTEVRYCTFKQSVNLLPFWSLESGVKAVDITRERSCRIYVLRCLYLSSIMVTMIVTCQCITLNY